MKAILMAGGQGTRIASIASDIPKPMIQIKNHDGVLKPVLQYEIESLVSQGFTDLIITVGYKKDCIIDYFGDGRRFGCRIKYYIEENPLGNAGAVVKLYGSGELDSDFLLLISDALFDIDFKRFVAFHREHDALATLFTHPNSHPYDSSLVICGNIADPNVVTHWINKEDVRPAWYKNRVNAGLHILNPDIIARSGIEPQMVGKSKKVDLDRDILGPALPSRRIYAYDSSEYVKDMGTPERFYSVCQDVKRGRVGEKNLSKQQKAVFLDRDGTLNKYVGFLHDINDFMLLPGVAEAIKKLNDAGWLCIVITNQPVIARGELTVEELDLIHNKMETLLGQKGAYLDGIYYCPHHPDKGFEGEVLELKRECSCRKPKPGLIIHAAEDFNIDLGHSWMVGDSWRDVQAGIFAGTKTVLLTDTGEEEFDPARDIKPDLSSKNLLDFVENYLMGKE